MPQWRRSHVRQVAYRYSAPGAAPDSIIARMRAQGVESPGPFGGSPSTRTRNHELLCARHRSAPHASEARYYAGIVHLFAADPPHAAMTAAADVADMSLEQLGAIVAAARARPADRPNQRQPLCDQRARLQQHARQSASGADPRTHHLQPALPRQRNELIDASGRGAFVNLLWRP